MTCRTNPKKANGYSALHAAASNSHTAICEIILDNTDIKNPEDNEKNTPLHCAARESNFDLFKRIMVESGDINPTDQDSQSPQKYAEWNNDKTLSELIDEMTNEKNFGWKNISSQPEPGKFDKKGKERKC